MNGLHVRTDSTPDTGQMVVPVATGENRVRIRFVAGWDLKLGLLLSGIGFAVLLLLSMIRTKAEALVKAGS